MSLMDFAMSLGFDLLDAYDGGSSAPASDVAVLVAALGGDSNVPAFYDTRYNVGATVAVCDTWDDARGPSGYGPQLVKGGSPAWDSTNKIITTNGSSSYLAVGANAAFDPTATGNTMIVIATLPAGNYPFVFTDNSAKWYGLKTQTTIAVAGVGGVGGLTTGNATGATRRLTVNSNSPINFFGAGVTPTGGAQMGMVFGRVGQEGQYFGQVGSGGGTVAGGWGFRIGNLLTTYSATAVRAVIVLNHPITGSEMASVVTWAKAYHAIVEDTSVSRMIMFDGNSLTAGTGAVFGTSDYPKQMMVAAPFSTNFDYANLGVGSRTGAAQLAAFPTRVAPALVSGAQTKKIYICWELTNDILAGLTDAQAVANVSAMCVLAKAAGATATVVPTCLPRVGFGTSGTKETYRLNANATLKAGGVAGIDAVVDVASIPQLTDYTNATYYNGDQTHLTPTGYGVLVSDATNGIAQATSPFA